MASTPQVKNLVENNTRVNVGTWQSFSSTFSTKNVGLILIGIGLLILITEVLFGLRFLLSVLFSPYVFAAYYFSKRAKTRLPFFMPMSSGGKVDYGNRKPGTDDKNNTRYGKAEGILYFGNCMQTQREIYFPNDVISQHIMYLGTTGSGKTVGQATFSSNFLIAGSGYSITDGKADLKLPIDHMSRCWRMNRIDSVFIVNYIRGEMDVWNRDPNLDIESNCYHPYQSSSSDTLSEITKALLDGDGDIWAKRAESYVPAMIKPNVYKRDKQNLVLTVDVLSDMLILEEAGKVLGDETIPDLAKSQLMKFIQTLPGMNEKAKATIMQGKSLGGRDGATILDQFGYVVMQIIPIMNMLSGDYGYIFNSPQTPTGHIDMEDIVINRRCLLILLPALETSVSSLASLGRITLAAQKSMMAKSLGSQLSGNTKKNTSGKPTSSPVSFLSDNDEVGYYLVEGTAVAAAQARSIGFCLLYGAQDLSAMRRLSDIVSKEVDSIWGNTNIKLFGRVLDNQTFEEIKKYVGEGYVARADRYTDSDSLIPSYKNESVTISRESLIEESDLQGLIEGEVYIHYMGRLVLMRIPMLATQQLSVIRLNDYISLGTTSSYNQVSVDKYKLFMNRCKAIMNGQVPASESSSLKDMSDVCHELENSTQLVEMLDYGIVYNTHNLINTELTQNAIDFEPDGDDSELLETPSFDDEREIAYTDDGLPYISDNITEEDIETLQGDDEHTISVSSDKLTTAKQIAEDTSGTFDSIFGVKGKEEVVGSVARLADAIHEKGLTPDPTSPKEDGQSLASRIVDELEQSVKHPVKPTLARDPSKSRQHLRSLIDAMRDDEL